MNDQLQLDFEAKPPAHDDIERLAIFLYDQGAKWTTAKQITEALGYADRQIRKLASESNGLILSGPGCPGYSHVRRATPEEVQEVVARLRHQAHMMDQRCSAIHKAFHAHVHKLA
jgi:hypothetical protein